VKELKQLIYKGIYGVGERSKMGFGSRQKINIAKSTEITRSQKTLIKYYRQLIKSLEYADMPHAFSQLVQGSKDPRFMGKTYTGAIESAADVDFLRSLGNKINVSDITSIQLRAEHVLEKSQEIDREREIERERQREAEREANRARDLERLEEREAMWTADFERLKVQRMVNEAKQWDKNTKNRADAAQKENAEIKRRRRNTSKNKPCNICHGNGTVRTGNYSDGFAAQGDGGGREIEYTCTKCNGSDRVNK
jgi:hypothetical protein